MPFASRSGPRQPSAPARVTLLSVGLALTGQPRNVVPNNDGRPALLTLGPAHKNEIEGHRLPQIEGLAAIRAKHLGHGTDHRRTGPLTFAPSSPNLFSWTSRRRTARF